MKTRLIIATIMILSIYGTPTAKETENNDMENLKLTQMWDKKFPQSDKVNHRKVTFKNRFGIELAADLYEPKNNNGEAPALAVAARSVSCRISGRSGFYLYSNDVKRIPDSSMIHFFTSTLSPHRDTSDCYSVQD